MDYSKIIVELKARRAELETAILALERLAQGGGSRRGRRPKWMTESEDEEIEPVETPQKRALSAEARARIAEAQRKRWAKARKTGKQSQD